MLIFAMDNKKMLLILILWKRLVSTDLLFSIKRVKMDKMCYILPGYVTNVDF